MKKKVSVYLGALGILSLLLIGYLLWSLYMQYQHAPLPGETHPDFLFGPGMRSREGFVRTALNVLVSLFVLIALTVVTVLHRSSTKPGRWGDAASYMILGMYWVMFYHRAHMDLVDYWMTDWDYSYARSALDYGIRMLMNGILWTACLYWIFQADTRRIKGQTLGGIAVFVLAGTCLTIPSYPVMFYNEWLYGLGMYVIFGCTVVLSRWWIKAADEELFDALTHRVLMVSLVITLVSSAGIQLSRWTLM